MSDWDHSVDLLIVGSGAGAMTAALHAHDRGGTTLLIEKTGQYGGNSAMSGGAMWVPNNRLMAEAGVEDTPAEALRYLSGVTRGLVPEAQINAYLETAPQMLDYLLERSRLRVQCMLTYPDYYADAPGGKPGGRSLEPEHFDGRLLGEEFDRLREPALQELVVGRMSMTATEAHHLLARHPGWVRLTISIMARYWADIGGRRKSKRDRRLSLGNALMAMLRASLMDRHVPIWLRTSAKEIIVEDGRVVGILAEKNGREMRLRGEKGVVLAAGGFESDPEMRKRYLPNPTQVEWTTGSTASTGDGHRMLDKLGVDFAFMDEAWWGPTTVVPGEERARMLVIEKGLPGCIFVNSAGQRFVNEASPYNEVVKAMYANNSNGASCVPAYMVFDTGYRKKYPCGPFLAGAQQPDWMLPKALKQGYLKKADTIEDLAAQLDIDAAGLKETLARFNDNARRGEDPDFKRGEGVFDRYYGDEHISPNACLAPLETAPYYGIEAYAGELGTKGGVKTDEKARVLNRDGQVIAGLYAIGNCAASVMGPVYPGAGATIGPGMTFGWIAARDAIAA